MTSLRYPIICLFALFATFVVRTPLYAHKSDANLIAQFADSALIDLLNNDPRQAEKWADAMMTIAPDSDMVVISQCLKACVRVAQGDPNGRDDITKSARHFNYRKDMTAQMGSVITYFAQGYYDYESSTKPNDIYFKKAERVAKEIGDKRLEAFTIAFRTQVYIRSQRYIEASYCARSLISICNESGFLDLQLLAKLYMLNVYSTVRMESAVMTLSQQIEAHPLFYSNPVYAGAYSRLMAIDCIRDRNFTEANVYSWRAFTIAQKCNLSVSERWTCTFVRAMSLFYLGHFDDAKQLTDSCKKYSDLVWAHSFSASESPYSLDLLRAHIDQATGNYIAAKCYLDTAYIPHELMEADDFAWRYNTLIEWNSVSRGDYRTARLAVLRADSLNRHSQLINSRALCKDMWLSSQDDTLVINKRRTVIKDEVRAEDRQVGVYAFVITALIASCSIIAFGAFRMHRKGKDAQQSDMKLNEQLVAEIDSSTKLIEEQNAIISKRNLDMAASRTYAKRMQRGIWPNPDKLVSMGIPFSFVLRGTSDAISSCFYWYRKVGDVVIVCCADSGLGDSVAGAMLSVVGLTIFNDAATKLSESKSAADLLRTVDSNFVTCLPDDTWRGGISASVAVIDTTNRVVNVACASAKALIYNEQHVSHVEDEHNRIGRFDHSSHRVKNYRFTFSKGDSVFLYTQAFTEVSNIAGEPLGDDGLKAIIERSVKLPPNLYHDVILNEIMYWRSSRPFNDDVLFVGFTLP